MNPLSRVIALANCFAELTIKNPNCPIPKSAQDAVSYIEVTMGQPFNRETFAALKVLLKQQYYTHVA